MRRVLPLLVALVLAMALAAPVAGSAGTFKSVTSYDAYAVYVSDLDPYAPGVHSALIVRFSSIEFRSTDSTGTPTTSRESIVQVVSSGYVPYTTKTWYAAYEQIIPPELAMGGVSRSLQDAWLTSGELDLHLQCFIDPCPTLPSRITVSGQWTSSGSVTTDVTRSTDSIDTVFEQVLRRRAATASIAFSYPAGDGPLVVPAYLQRTFIASSHQVTTGVAPGSGADMIVGNGMRNSVAFEFQVVVTPSGNASGRFDSTLMSNTGLPFQGTVDCGWVKGNIGVFGGLIDGADPGSPNSYFTVMVSDFPDGIIIGNGRPDCGTTGFGWPGSLPISSGDIVVIDR